MKITTVSYGKTFNLGDYESERIDMSAELSEEDTPEGVLETLRELVGGSGAVRGHSTAPLVDLSQYPLHNYQGLQVFVFDTASDWLTAYDSGANKTIDIRKYVMNNEAVFENVKAHAASNENPRALNRVQAVEARVGGLINNG